MSRWWTTRTASGAPAFLRRWLNVAIALAVGLGAFGVFATATFRTGPAAFSIDLDPAIAGRTSVVLPPFGRVGARTHIAPLNMRVALEEIDVLALEALADEGIPDGAAQELYRRDFLRGAVRSALTGLLAAVLAAAVVGWGLARRWATAALSAAVTFALVLSVLVWTTATFDLSAFRSPQYVGAVKYAPALVSLVERRVKDVDSLRRQIEKTAKDLATYYRAPQSFQTGGGMRGTLRVLHVSDIHLDPVGLRLARDLAREFDVAFVIDTGDINLYGSRVEASVVASGIPSGLPRVFVPGNHESPAVVRALEALPNVQVLDERATVVSGVRIYGIPDPGASTGAFEAGSAAQLREAGRLAARRLRERLASGEPTPTVIAVHNPLVELELGGIAPLVLSGHTHTPKLRESDGTWFLNSGSTGGVHFTELRSDPHIPHSASVLYFTAELPRRLIAIDRIEVLGTELSSSVTRQVVAPELLPN